MGSQIKIEKSKKKEIKRITEQMQWIENSKMVDFNLIMSIITLNVNCLNIPIERYYQIG